MEINDIKLLLEFVSHKMFLEDCQKKGYGFRMWYELDGETQNEYLVKAMKSFGQWLHRNHVPEVGSARMKERHQWLSTMHDESWKKYQEKYKQDLTEYEREIIQQNELPLRLDGPSAHNLDEEPPF